MVCPGSQKCRRPKVGGLMNEQKLQDLDRGDLLLGEMVDDRILSVAEDLL